MKAALIGQLILSLGLLSISGLSLTGHVDTAKHSMQENRNITDRRTEDEVSR